mgnify:CR=1 FL=1
MNLDASPVIHFDSIFISSILLKTPFIGIGIHNRGCELKPEIYLSMYGKRYICNHPVYDSCTLFQIGEEGLAVIVQVDMRLVIQNRRAKSVKLNIHVAAQLIAQRFLDEPRCQSSHPFRFKNWRRGFGCDTAAIRSGDEEYVLDRGGCLADR